MASPKNKNRKDKNKSMENSIFLKSRNKFLDKNIEEKKKNNLINQSYTEQRGIESQVRNKSKSRRRNMRRKDMSRSSSKTKKGFHFHNNSNNFSSLYKSNMQFLIKSTRESSVYRKFEMVKKNMIDFNIDEDSIPKDKYYISYLLESLLRKRKKKRNKQFLEHFSLCCQSVLYISKIEKPGLDKLEGKFLVLPKSKFFFEKKF